MGLPCPMTIGWTYSLYSSIRSRRMNAAARSAPPSVMSPPGCALSSIISSATTSRRTVVFQSARSRVVENTIFGISRQMRANSSTGPMVEFARIWRDMPKIVFSTTLERADWNTTVRRDVVAEEIMELKAQPGGDMTLGGADLAAAFMRRDLIDEYRLYVHPIVIGQGKPMFQPSDTKINLQLAETRTFGNGVVLLRYERP